MKLKNIKIPAIAIGLLAGVLFLGGFYRKPAPLVIQGEVEATEVSVAAKIAGRIKSLPVREGQNVAQREMVAQIESPELEAKLTQAEAAAEAADAQRDKAENGARNEEIRAAKSQWQAAVINESLAQKTYERIARLYADNVVSAQKRDEAEASLRAARQSVAAAKAAYDMAVSGARNEDREAAEAQAAQARGVISEVQASLEETKLQAPISGELTQRVVEVGELVSAGFPLVKIVDLNEIWVVFNLREDLLADIHMGSQLNVQFPALNNLSVPLQVDYISCLGDFATWRATRATGDFDMKTFEVRARPIKPVPGLRPGMTAVLDWSAMEANLRAEKN